MTTPNNVEIITARLSKQDLIAGILMRWVERPESDPTTKEVEEEMARLIDMPEEKLRRLWNRLTPKETRWRRLKRRVRMVIWGIFGDPKTIFDR